jgi:two-component sensor histidine kinase
MSDPSIQNAIYVDQTQLPALPHLLLELIDACLESDASFETLAEIIQKDAGLSASVMVLIGTSGLGLTIVKHLVSELGGAISCSNKKGGGAEFVILLPRKIV